MPNWCDCEITIKGESKILQTLIDKVCSETKDSANKLVLDTNKILPYPEEYRIKDEIHEKWFNEHYKDGQLIVEDGSKEPEDGFNNGGYDWCAKNWGTKWGLTNTQLDKAKLSNGSGVLMYSCDTAWMPPTGLMLALSKLFPDLHITLNYWECGDGFKGTAKYHNGECIHSKTSVYMGNRGG